MAAYREHISVSGVLGLVYGAMGAWGLGFSLDQAGLAAFLTWVAGMLPDLDSKSGKPIRELFSLLAIVVPLGMMQHLVRLGGNPERVILFAILTYLMIRYGGASLLSRLAVHRGMFHSIPALIIAAELTFLGYGSHSLGVRSYMSAGVAIGFFSHLLLDEMYSVQWDGLKIRLAKSAGSALKLASKRFVPNAFAYGLMFFLTYLTMVDVGILAPPPETATASDHTPESSGGTQQDRNAPSSPANDEDAGTTSLQPADEVDWGQRMWAADGPARVRR